jgi:hypothetical protein
MERRPQKQYKKLVSAAPKKRIGAVHEKKKKGTTSSRHAGCQYSSNS